MPPSCSSPSAISCVPLSGGSYSWLGCYQDTTSATGFPVSVGTQFPGFTGTATDCITVCSTGNAGEAYNYASIEAGSCYCGTSVSSLAAPVSASLCNIFCSDNTLCGGYDGVSLYSEAYMYNPGGTLSCPAVSTTTTSSSTTMSTSTTSTSSATSPTGTSEIHITPLPKMHH
jgi:hypothetical protein